MSWFDGVNLTSFAKTALEGAQRSIDKVLDIDGATANVSKSSKGDTKAATQKRIVAVSANSSSKPQKSVSPPKSSPQKQKSVDSSSDVQADNSGGDFWSSFLGGYTTTSSSSSSVLSSSATSSGSSLSSSIPSKPIKPTRQNDKLGRKVSDTSVSTNKPDSKEKPQVKPRGSKSDEDIKLSSKQDRRLQKADLHVPKVLDVDISSDQSTESASGGLLVSNKKCDKQEAPVDTLKTKSDDDVVVVINVISGGSKQVDSTRNLSVIKQLDNKKGSTVDIDGKITGTPDILQGTKNEDDNFHDIAKSSAIGKKGKRSKYSKIRDKKATTGDSEMVKDDDVFCSGSGKGRKNILRGKCDLEKSTSHGDVDARTKGPDMVDGLDDAVISEERHTVPQLGGESTMMSNELHLDLVCNNSLIDNTQDIGSTLEPVAASTPFQDRHMLEEFQKEQIQQSEVSDSFEEVSLKEELNMKGSLGIEGHDKNTKDATGKFAVEAECNNDAWKIDEEMFASLKGVGNDESSLTDARVESAKVEKSCTGEDVSIGEIKKDVELNADEENTATQGDHQNEAASIEKGEIVDVSAGKTESVTPSTSALIGHDDKNMESTSTCMSADEEPNSKVTSLLKEVECLQEVVEAREKKMVELSKENIDLQETSAILRSQLTQLESAQQEEDSEMETMRQEFTIRVAATENKLQAIAKERDQMKRELEDTTCHLTALNERQNEEFTTLIREKDEQIAQLLLEGEKLSKQELQSNTIIKKLRAKEKESDTLVKQQGTKVEELETEVKQLTEVLTSRDESQCKQEDAIIKFNAYAKKQEEQIAKQRSELDDANEKARGLQTALDNAYKELSGLHKDKAAKNSITQEAVLSAEVNAKEELRIILEKARREFHQDSEQMALQITDLQSDLSRGDQQSTRREDNLRQEISDLQQRLQDAEGRNQELATSVSHATRPLLRQIENLQNTHSNQTSTWEKVERNLTDRLNEAQNQLVAAQEKERTASQHAFELNSRTSSLESQVTSYRADRSRLEAELEMERTKIRSMEDVLSRNAAKMEALHSKYKKMIEESNQDKAHVEQQLAVEKSRIETERKKMKAALEEKERRLSRQASQSSFPPPSPTSDSPDSVPQKGHVRMSSTGSRVLDGLSRSTMGGTTAVVERLQAQVRQKDGEIDLLQEDVTSLERSRDSVMEELTRITSTLESLETTHEELVDLRTKYQDMQQRYNAVLQMYGEKEEEAEELRLDLQDVKSMYKQQLEQLFGTTR